MAKTYCLSLKSVLQNIDPLTHRTSNRLARQPHSPRSPLPPLIPPNHSTKPRSREQNYASTPTISTTPPSNVLTEKSQTYYTNPHIVSFRTIHTPTIRHMKNGGILFAQISKTPLPFHFRRPQPCVMFSPSHDMAASKNARNANIQRSVWDFTVPRPNSHPRANSTSLCPSCRHLPNPSLPLPFLRRRARHSSGQFHSIVAVPFLPALPLLLV